MSRASSAQRIRASQEVSEDGHRRRTLFVKALRPEPLLGGVRNHDDGPPRRVRTPQLRMPFSRLRSEHRDQAGCPPSRASLAAAVRLRTSRTRSGPLGRRCSRRRRTIRSEDLTEVDAEGVRPWQLRRFATRPSRSLPTTAAFSPRTSRRERSRSASTRSGSSRPRRVAGHSGISFHDRRDGGVRRRSDSLTTRLSVRPPTTAPRSRNSWRTRVSSPASRSTPALTRSRGIRREGDRRPRRPPSTTVEYARLGARFAKWRAVITIGEGIPTALCIDVNAHALARYAALCQEAGLVPIIEPEALMDGEHTIDVCEEVTDRTLQGVYAALDQHGVDLAGTLLKPNMVIAGKGCPRQADAATVAQRTVSTLRRHVPEAVRGIVFLSAARVPRARRPRTSTRSTRSAAPGPCRSRTAGRSRRLRSPPGAVRLRMSSERRRRSSIGLA